MPRKRSIKENKGLPERWRFKNGAYRYRVPKGLEHLWDNKKEFSLGKTLPEAYAEWAKRIDVQDKNNMKVKDLLERYAAEVVPTKALKTQEGDASKINRLNKVFGDMEIETVTPQHIYKYVDKRSAKVAAKREFALLSHAYTKAIEWGYLNKHPFKGQVVLKNNAPRERYIEDWEIIECLSLDPKTKKGGVRTIQAYIKLKLLTGLRRADMLRLKISDCKEDGIHVRTSKTGKAIIYEWTSALRTAVEECRSVRPVDISPYLFCTKYGKSYYDENTPDPSGWNSMWQRFMKRIMSDETKISERFTEHDLRAKCASDAESTKRAQELLTHADARITERVYRRKPTRIKPAK